MGRLGVAGDEHRLIELLTDREWWVRYRAARALAGLGFVGAARMRAIQAAQTDAYARDIIEQVLAERAIVERA
jgi:HEAT repeat protein